MYAQQRKLTLIAAAMALALSACDKTPDVNNNPATTATPPSSPRSADATVGTKIEDATITAQVKSKLIADDDLKARDINVDTSNGAVTLRGTVGSPELKDKATLIARQVDGVMSVNNELVVGST